ncbi:class I fructose-bisphosphate aldolase [Patescibacteria group bacterium]
MIIMSNLKSTAEKLVDSEKGILAADESLPTIKKRFDSIGVESTEETRKEYRELLFTTQDLEKYISGIILFDESTKHKTKDGKEFPKILTEKGIIPGVKVDMGKIDLPNHPGEKITQGLDGLGERLDEYSKLGLKFTKWRAVFSVSEYIPTQNCITSASHSLALFAIISQSKGFVPIIEPEVLMEGKHTLERCETVTRAVLTSVFITLQDYKADLEGLLLKVNMIISGSDAIEKTSADEIASTTKSVLERTVPKSIPGIVFLSGGQTPDQACTNLNAINKGKGESPWELSFSFGRALQKDALDAWKGEKGNINKAQEVFLKRAREVSLARQGKYDKK